MANGDGNGLSWIRVVVPIVMVASSTAGVGIWWAAKIEESLEHAIAAERQARRDLQEDLIHYVNEIFDSRKLTADAVVADYTDRIKNATERLNLLERRWEVNRTDISENTSEIADIKRRLERLENIVAPEDQRRSR